MMSKLSRVPRLRFPEFRHAKGWDNKQLGDILSVGNGRDHKHLADGDIPAYGSGGYMRSVNEYLYDGASACIGRKGTIDKPVFLTGKFWTVDTLFFTHSYEGSLPLFVYAIFQNINWLNHNEAGGVPSLSKANIEKINIDIPSLEEQQKIADCLTSVDDLITAEVEKLTALKDHKKGLMQQLFPREGETKPRLRFPEFHDAYDWEEKPLGKLISTVTPPRKLQTSAYASSGSFPIVDQSQEYICGWTNDEDAIIYEGLPYIVFGDHTCAVKFIDQPFAQGADGIKILDTVGEVSKEFLFQSLQASPLGMNGYRRHFSILKEKIVTYPQLKTGEQQKITDFLTTIDDLITAQTKKLKALKDHKKGLIQQLFPANDEVNG